MYCPRHELYHDIGMCPQCSDRGLAKATRSDWWLRDVEKFNEELACEGVYKFLRALGEKA